MLRVEFTPHGSKSLDEVFLHLLVAPPIEPEPGPAGVVGGESEPVEEEVDLPGTAQAFASGDELGLEREIGRC